MADDKIQTIALSKIAAELAEKHEMSKKAAGEFLSAFVELTVKNLKKGHKVRVTGLGIFQVKKRPARMGRNPATGEAIKIKASKKLAFRAAKEVKDAIRDQSVSYLRGLCLPARRGPFLSRMNSFHPGC